MSIAVATTTEKEVSYTPLGSKGEVKLTVNMVRKFLCTPTRSGVQPDDAQVVKFMMLCRARELDPWVGDAYLVGYDGNDGAQFSLITAHQALLKRAEICPTYDGMESGVIVKSGETVTFREGDFTFDNETLIGGWARCHRKDQSHASYDAVKFSTFNTNRSRWKADPAGMIVKVAEASVLRKAFPTQIGGLYIAAEMDSAGQSSNTARPSVPIPQAMTFEQPAQKAIANDPGEVISSDDFTHEAETVPVAEKTRSNGKTKQKTIDDYLDVLGLQLAKCRTEEDWQNVHAEWQQDEAKHSADCHAQGLAKLTERLGELQAE